MTATAILDVEPSKESEYEVGPSQVEYREQRQGAATWMGLDSCPTCMQSCSPLSAFLDHPLSILAHLNGRVHSLCSNPLESRHW